MFAIPARNSPQGKATLVLATSPWLIAIWKYYADPQFLQSRFVGLWGADIPAGAGALASMVATFVLMGVLPALVVRLVFGESLDNYGLGLGNVTRTFRSFLIVLPFAVAGTYGSSMDPQVAAVYPLNPDAGRSLELFGLHAAAYASFYLGWEFYFRGFMQQGLAPACGIVPAVLVQTLASGLAHIGKPPIELFASIVGGMLWGWLVCRTRSIVSGCLLHAVLGIGLDAFLCLRAAGWQH